jgi:hypothetical protein
MKDARHLTWQELESCRMGQELNMHLVWAVQKKFCEVNGIALVDGPRDAEAELRSRLLGGVASVAEAQVLLDSIVEIYVADARRYRHIRNPDHYEQSLYRKGGYGEDELKFGKELDKAIDEIIARSYQEAL